MLRFVLPSSVSFMVLLRLHRRAPSVSYPLASSSQRRLKLISGLTQRTHLLYLLGVRPFPQAWALGFGVLQSSGALPVQSLLCCCFFLFHHHHARRLRSHHLPLPWFESMPLPGSGSIGVGSRSLE